MPFFEPFAGFAVDFVLFAFPAIVATSFPLREAQARRAALGDPPGRAGDLDRAHSVRSRRLLPRPHRFPRASASRSMGPVPPPARLAEVLLFALTVAWGTTFVLVKDAVATLSPWTFLFARFGLAAVCLFALAALQTSRGPGEGRKPGEAWAGVVVGAALFAGYALQTWGLTLTTPARSGFLTGLSVVMVPCLEALLGRPPAPRAWLGALFSAVGLLFLTRPGSGPFGAGEWLTLLCALAFAIQTIAVDRFARIHSALRLAAVESLTVFALSGAAGLFQAALSAARAGGADSPPGLGLLLIALVARGWTGEAVLALAVCGVVVTALGTAAQNWAQRFTTATRAAVIFTFEPVFALASAWAFWGERWPLAALAGGGLVLAGMLASASRRPHRGDRAA